MRRRPAMSVAPIARRPRGPVKSTLPRSSRARIRARCIATCRLSRMKPRATWLQRALIKGEVTDARLKLAGDLAQFPFADGKTGSSSSPSRRRGVTLDFAEHWPPIEAIDGEIRFEGASMAIDAARGRVFGAQIGRTRAGIADLRAAPPRLAIEGSATGSIHDFLRFVAESPVDVITGHVTRGRRGCRLGAARSRPRPAARASAKAAASAANSRS